MTYMIKLLSKTLEKANKYTSYAQEGKGKDDYDMKRNEKDFLKDSNQISRDENDNS